MSLQQAHHLTAAHILLATYLFQTENQAHYMWRINQSINELIKYILQQAHHYQFSWVSRAGWLWL